MFGCYYTLMKWAFFTEIHTPIASLRRVAVSNSLELELKRELLIR